ncbi:MAG: hypothetical protein IPM50_02575 [Acidobacteriota bacterium]|nr:MAG: hypothetical protein IPM50_02575 [Acidobacteriota bacterium]
MAGGRVNGFQVARFAADGSRILLANTTVTITDVTTGFGIGSVETDAFGNLADFFVDADPGDLLEFSVPGYPEVFRRLAAATHDEAARMPENLDATFVVEYLPTERETDVMGEVWLEKLGDPDAVDHLLGYGRPGTTPSFIMPDVADGLFRVYVNTVTRTGQRTFTNYRQAPSQMLTADSATGIPSEVDPNLVFAGPATGETADAPEFRPLVYKDLPRIIRSLFDVTATEVSDGNTDQILHSVEIPANLFEEDGDKVTFNYALRLLSDQVDVRIEFGGEELFNSADVGSLDKLYSIIVDGWVIRTGAMTARSFTRLHVHEDTKQNWYWSDEKEVTADFVNTIDLDLVLGNSVVDCLELRSGYGLFFPKAEPIETPPPPPFTWTPAELPDIVHWYRVREMTGIGDNDPVTSLPDLIGSAHIPAPSGKEPIYKANSGDPYVEFDGVDDLLADGSIWTSVTQLTMCIVFEVVSDVATFDRYICSYNWTFNKSNSGADAVIWIPPGGPYTITRNIPARPTGDMVAFMEHSGSSGRFRLNGSEATGSGSLTASHQGLGIAGDPYGGNASNIRLKEIIYCNAALSSGDFTLLSTYLNLEYGVTL